MFGKHLFIVLFTAVLFTQGCKNRRTTKELELRVTVLGTEQYCGGARPTDEVIQSLEREHLLRNLGFILITAEGRDSIKIRTDSQGTFSIKGKQGTHFKGFAQIKSNEPMPGFGGPKCEKWRSTPNFAFTLEKENIEVKCHLTCNPCEPAAP